MEEEKLNLNAVGMNPIGTAPIHVDALPFVYEKLIGEKHINPDAPPRPGQYGAFPGQKTPIVDPRLS